MASARDRIAKAAKKVQGAAGKADEAYWNTVLARGAAASRFNPVKPLQTAAKALGKSGAWKAASKVMEPIAVASMGKDVVEAYRDWFVNQEKKHPTIPSKRAKEKGEGYSRDMAGYKYGGIVRAGANLVRNPEAVRAALSEMRAVNGKTAATAAKMTAQELAAAAKRIGTSVQNVIKAEKSLASSGAKPLIMGHARDTEYAFNAMAERGAATATKSGPMDQFSRRAIQDVTQTAKRVAGKAYQALKDAASSGKKAPKAAVEEIASKMKGTSKQAVTRAIQGAVRRGTAPGVAAAALSQRKNEEPRQGYKYGGVVKGKKR